MTTYPSSDDDKALEAYMDAVEGTGPQTTLFALLQDASIPLPSPQVVTDSELPAVLWKVIHAMADVGAFLDSTNHLSDRELYTVVWNDILRGEYPIVPEEFPMTCTIDILGGWSNEDIQTYLTYYADEESRKNSAHWGTSIPDHIDPPYQRDNLLPKCGY